MYAIGMAETKEMDLLGRECLVISNESGGGEQDTTMDWSSVPISRKNLRLAPSSSSDSISKAQVELPISRANSPVIQSFIEEQVEAANRELQDTDSLREFCEEGGASDAGSLSSICSSLDDEEYTLERLRNAGPQFEVVAELLGKILTSENDIIIDSGSEVARTRQ